MEVTKKNNIYSHCGSEIRDGTNFVVQRICDRKWHKGEYYYLIKWEGKTAEDNTWEPKENLTDVHEMIQEFNSNYNEDKIKLIPLRILSAELLNTGKIEFLCRVLCLIKGREIEVELSSGTLERNFTKFWLEFLYSRIKF